MLCPYCGNYSSSKKECDRCRGLFEPLSRQASQNGMGPWFIRDEGNPFRPGCSYATMRMLVSRKRIVAESVLRGPSTRQFWTFAKNTPGIAHLLGECHACHKAALAEATRCAQCNASFEVEEDRQFLGLAEVRVIPGQPAPEGARTARSAPVSEPAAEPQPMPRGYDYSANSISLTEPGDASAEPVAATAYEPIRNAARPGRQRAEMSEREIDDLLRRSGEGKRAGERVRRSTTIVVVLVMAALLAVVLMIVLAVVIYARGTGAVAGGATVPAPVTPSPTVPAGK